MKEIRLKNLDFYKSLSPYQKEIVLCMNKGAKLQSSEGKHYKTWLVFNSGKRTPIRRNSAESICNKGGDEYFVFGEPGGIRLK
jgi:hypothetical protein